MIEATCSACGTLNRVSEANVPIGAKFVTCSDCKSRIAITSAAPPPRQPPALPKPAVVTAKPADLVGLSDLPAPKRASALGAGPPRPAGRPPAIPAKPAAMRSGLAAALDPDLPAPKPVRSTAAMHAVVPPTVELDDPRGGAMLPDDADLPAPKRPVARVAEPARMELDDVVDLPAPKMDRGVIDLPAPKRTIKRSVPDMPVAPPPPLIADLPAPKRGPNIPDVPTPRMADLAPRQHGNADLPAPTGFFDDLPQVNTGPSPGTMDLPAPKGYFENIPALPNANRPELPAPKGYFDDLPQPALHQRPELPAPKGYFDDIPQVKSHPSGRPELPAPKGYFDDIPGLPLVSKPELPAPKGFFDDIPGLPHKTKPEVPAPKGHFENLPGRPTNKADDLAPKGFFDDLPQPGPAATVRAKGVTQNPPMPGGSGELVLEGGPELELIAPPDAGASSFDDLDLSKPTSPVRFDPQPRPPVAQMSAPLPRYDVGPTLELEGALPEPTRSSAKRPVKPVPEVDDAAAAGARARRNKLVAGGLAAAIALGAGGFVLYQRHVASEERASAIAEQLQIARKSYAAGDPMHWQRAAAAARRVVDLDDHHPEALGLAAESLFASVLGDGTAVQGKLAQARGLLDTASSAGISSPQLARARALSMLAAHQPDVALGQLQPLATHAPKDAVLALYLGWAQDARGDAEAAIKSYDVAAAEPQTQIAALYGRGNAKLELADLDGARADFSALLEHAKDHIGAQVGLAAAQPPSAAQQQEADLLAILARKDIATADPRAIGRAWTLAGIAAARAGRSAVARDRFRKALAVVPQDLAATTGLAETELRDGKLVAAAELTAAALNLSKDNVPAQLVQSEIELQQGKLPLATQRLAALANHATPLLPLEQARLELVTGKLLESEGKNGEAVEAYIRGAKVARDLDLAPLMAAVGKLAAMTAAAVSAKDPRLADELRARAEQLLVELAGHAEKDPRLALTLGMAYLEEGDPAKAETWLRRAAVARPSDAEVRYQLGRALLKAGRTDEALAALNAALGFDQTRADIGVELARAYEALGRDAEAGARYQALLAAKEPSIELRARAGRYYARTGAFDKASEQGTKIVEADARNATGLYLQGEGLLAAGKPLEAKQLFQHALEVERDPQYLDGLGRAAEALSQGGDRGAQDLALRSYLAAAETAPTMFNSLAGQGRLYVARHEAAKAVTPLLAAAGLEPKNPEVMFLLGAAYQELQQSRIALQWLEASTQIAPRAEAFWRIGQLYRDGNQGAKAADAIASATRLAEDSEKRIGKPISWLSDALYLQGRINFDLHNEPRAREAWTRYLARNPPPSARLTEVKQLLGTSLR